MRETVVRHAFGSQSRIVTGSGSRPHSTARAIDRDGCHSRSQFVILNGSFFDRQVKLETRSESPIFLLSRT